MCRYRYPIAVAAILLLAIVARCATAVWWQERLEQQGKHFAFGDSESYWRLAIAIAEDQTYAYGGENGRIFRVPLYPLMIAPFIDSIDPYRHVLSVRLLGSLLGTLAVGGIIVLGRDIFGRPASLCAGLLAAFQESGHSRMPVYRETLDTSLRVGIDALRALGLRATRATRAAQLFRRHDEAAVLRLQALRRDAGFLSAARQEVDALERTIEDDLATGDLPRDSGWDVESLRADAVSGGLAASVTATSTDEPER